MENPTPPPFPPPPPSPFQAPVRKKGLHPAAWAGIGCGGLVIVAVVLAVIGGGKLVKDAMAKLKEHPAKDAAEAVLREYPDLDKSGTNPEAGTVMLSSKANDEVVTTTYDDIAHGRTLMKDASGVEVKVFQGDLAKLPAWVPRYPGATGETSLLHKDEPVRIHGIIVADTTDSLSAVETFLSGEAGKLFSMSASSRSSMDMNGARSLKLGYSGGKKKLEFHVYGAKGAPLTVVTVYGEEK
ncbi:hypothetical protein [Luteolibacter sp. Populi]|uniref:hypothetical protein n=1 Tax=Luteolibacter sp. Populi TaxID=3230487 RepID=UPI0034660980